MKKFLRILLKTLAVIVVIVAAFLFYSLSRIDNTPYFETKYYKGTIDKLNDALKNRKISDGKLYAGFGKVSITPRIEPGKPDDPSKGEFNHIKMAGFGEGQIAKGIYDSVFVKAVALKVDDNLAVLVSGDILFMAPDVAEMVKVNVKKELGLSRGRLFFGASHTHSSWGNFVPALIGKLFGGDYNPEVVKWLSQRYTEVIKKAVEDLKPAEMGTGYAHVPNLVKNRIVGKSGRLNDKLTVVSVNQDNGRKAVIGIFAAHPVVIGDWSDKMGGDYPGEFQKALESEGVDMAMFFAGTVGSHTNKGKGERFEKISYIGKTLADSARAVISRLDYADTVNFSFVSSKMALPRIQPIYVTECYRLSPQMASHIFPEIGDSYVQGLKVNNFIWFTTPGELSGELAIDLKNALEVDGYNSAFTSFNGQYLGYVIPMKYYYYDTYEARLMGWFGPYMGDYLMELDNTIARSFTGVRL